MKLLNITNLMPAPVIQTKALAMRSRQQGWAKAAAKVKILQYRNVYIETFHNPQSSQAALYQS